NITPPLTGDLNPVAEMLVYFESNGDFPNSNLAPALIEAEEVFVNLTSFLILDIRTQAEYSSGHIEHAINVSADSLYILVEANFYSGYPKIVIISKNGQSSAYFTCLLRLAGFNNVYTMNFGMASWNEVFAVEWSSILGDYSGINNFTDNPFDKNEYTSLPQFSFVNPDDPIENRIKSRIEEIISYGFKQGQEYLPTLPNLNDKYPICYGKTNLYNARKFGVFDEMGHPPNTRSYTDFPNFELRSVKYLQTLPTSIEIVLYDYDGQLGACMTAYLRVLGYDVKMLLFGANQLFYSRLIDDPELINFAFSSEDIQSYPYITGE
ncbi:MAG: rhodanese-like domain-containing protein, partial [Ignavibacteria bacterium]|nr:rhodanese-like domain-containing protein [Ignavibacteria bacterium]